MIIIIVIHLFAGDFDNHFPRCFLVINHSSPHRSQGSPRPSLTIISLRSLMNHYPFYGPCIMNITIMNNHSVPSLTHYPLLFSGSPGPKTGLKLYLPSLNIINQRIINHYYILINHYYPLLSTTVFRFYWAIIIHHHSEPLLV